MGKKNRIKKQKQQMTAAQKPPLMDPTLIKAYTRGRDIGYRDGRVEGAAEVFMLFSEFVEDIDKHVKGIGPKTKIDIELYLANKIKETVEGKNIDSANITILKDIPASNQ